MWEEPQPLCSPYTLQLCGAMRARAMPGSAVRAYCGVWRKTAEQVNAHAG